MGATGKLHVHAALPPEKQPRSTHRIGDAVPIELSKINSVAVVRERTVPTERPPLVGQVSANLCG
jgi:hypothetical protein